MERHLVLESSEYDRVTGFLNEFMKPSTITVNNDHMIVTYDIPASRITFKLDDEDLTRVKFETLED